MLSVLVSELITQEHIAVGSSNFVQGLTCDLPCMANDQGQMVERSQGHVTYQQQQCCNSATDGRINFELGDNFHREGQNVCHPL